MTPAPASLLALQHLQLPWGVGHQPRVLTSSWSPTSPGVCRASQAQREASVLLFLSYMGGGAAFPRHRVEGRRPWENRW